MSLVFQVLIFASAAQLIGISGLKFRPNLVEGGFVDQNGLRGLVDGEVGIGTKTSPALEKIRAEMKYC